jgi:hypothetical protein
MVVSNRASAVRAPLWHIAGHEARRGRIAGIGLARRVRLYQQGAALYRARQVPPSLNASLHAIVPLWFAVVSIVLHCYGLDR